MNVRFIPADTSQDAVIHNTKAGLEYTKDMPQQAWDSMIVDISFKFMEMQRFDSHPEFQLMAICGLIGVATLDAAHKERIKRDASQPASNS